MIETIVSPTLNKGEKEKLKSELNAIFTDASKIDFNTPETRASLNSLTNAFKAIFSAAGITNIDFNELINMPAANSFAKLGELASTQFWDAWNAVATQSNKNGIVNNVQQQLAQLERERASSMKQLNSVKQMMDRYDNAAGVAYLELDEFSQLPKQKDIDKQANMVMDQYDDSLTKLSELTKGAKGYNLALLQAFESYENLFRMKATIDANMDNVSDETLKMYDVRTLKALTKPFVAKYGSEMDTVSEKAVDHYSAKISTLKEGLAGIDAQISAIKQNNSEIISQSDADTTSQRLKQIEEAYNRILNKSGTINKKAKEKIESALGYTAGEQSLTTLKKGYEKSLVSGENWEVQYQWILKFVKEYEAYAKSPDVNSERLKKYTVLYEQLKPMAANAENMLRNVLNSANNLVNTERLAEVNRKTAEEAERKAKADREAADAARQAAEATERERLAQEEAVKAVKEKSSVYTPGGILDNPTFANMFGKTNKDSTSSSIVQENESLTEQSSILTNIQKLTSYIDEKYLSAGKHLHNFLDDLQSKSITLDSELKNILSTLGLINDKGDFTFNIKRNGESGGGTTHSGALISDNFVIIERDDYQKVKNSNLPTSTQRAYKNGMNVAQVYGYLPSKYTNSFFDVQSTAKGHNLFEGGVLSQDVVNATEQQLQQLVNAFIMAREHGFDIENGGSNIVYDSKEGFSFYDLEEFDVDRKDEWNGFSDSEKALDALYDAISIFNGENRDNGKFENDPNVTNFIDKFKRAIGNDSRFKGLDYNTVFDEVFNKEAENYGLELMKKFQDKFEVARKTIKEDNIDGGNISGIDGISQSANTAKQAVDSLNSSLAKKNQLEQADKPQMEVAEEDAKTEALKRQNQTLGENNRLKTEQISMTNGSAVMGTNINSESIVKTNVQPNVNTIPSTSSSAEVSSLETIRAKVAEVTTAINLKTEAFTKEESEVQRVVTSEIETLDLLEQKVTVITSSIEGLLDNIRTGQSDIGAGLNNIVVNVNHSENSSRVEFNPESFDRLVSAINNIHPQTTDVGNVLATESTLKVIRSVVETINSKISPHTTVKAGSNTDVSTALAVIEDSSNGNLGTVVKDASLSNSQSTDERFIERKRTALTSLLKYKTTLQEANQLHGDLENGINTLSNELNSVLDQSSLTTWNEHFKQFKNASSILQTLVKDYEALGEAEAKAEAETNETKKSQYLDNAQIIRDRIDTKMVDVNINDDRFEMARQRAYNLASHKLQQKAELSAVSQQEAEEESRIKELSSDYEKLGQLRARAYKANGKNEKQSLEDQVKLQEESIRIKQQGLILDQSLYDIKALDAYNKELDKINQKLARKQDQENTSEQKRAFRNAVQQSRQEAGISSASSALNKGRNTLLSAVSIDGLTDSQIERLKIYQEQIEKLNDLYYQIKNSDGAVTEEQKQELIGQTNNVNTLNKEINELISEYNRLSGDNAQVIGINKLSNDASLKEYKKQLTDVVMAATNGAASITGFDADTKTLSYTIKTGAYEITEYTASARQLDGQLVALQGNTKKLETPFESLKRKAKELFVYFGGANIIYRTFSELKQGITYIKEIDSALTELKKVTDETEETYDRFLNTAAKTADKVGSTIKEVVSSTADFARLGSILAKTNIRPIIQ